MPAPDASVVALGELGRGDLALAGGKAANLGELIRAGFRVPEGFCVTTGAYRREADRVPDELAAACVRAYRALGSGPVAVRSSATAEDLPGASFAGQQETVLNVVGEDALLAAIPRCWASLFTDRAVAYRRSLGVDERGLALAVVVQRMVDARAAGVLFTADPVTGRRRRAVVDASGGLGEAVVSGAVDPDRYVADPDTGAVLERTVATKRLRVEALPGGGTRRVIADDARPALSDEEVAELARTGARIEALFGAPQDVEWAFDREGALWILQARPITTLHPLPAGASAEGFRVYFNFSVAQGVLQPITPMGIQVFRRLSAGLAAALGFPVADADAGAAVVAPAAGWLLIDVTGLARSAIGRVIGPRALGIMETRSAALLAAIYADTRLALRPRSRRQAAVTLLRIAERTRLPLLVARALVRPAGAAARASAAGDAALAFGDTPPAAAPELRLRAIERLFDEGPRPILAGVAPPLFAGMLAWQLARRLLGRDASAADFDVARRALPYNPTTEMDLALWALARRGADGPAAQEVGLAEFLRAYGHRGVAEIDVGVPRMAENADAFAGTLAGYAALPQGAEAPDARFARGVREAEAMVAELGRRAGRRGLARGLVARFALDRMRRLAGLREAPKFHIVRLIARAREHLLAIGGTLAREGRLARADDVFFLTLPEVRGALAGAEVAALVGERRAERAREQRRRHLPRFLYSDGTEPAGTPPAPREDGALVGTPASVGVVEGAARVVLDPAGARIEPGEILVAPSTDPGWTPLFLTAGGLVMEMGGPMSHGAVVAREHGIPAVVGLPAATERIRTGERLRVDGGAGTVERLAPPPEIPLQ